MYCNNKIITISEEICSICSKNTNCLRTKVIHKNKDVIIISKERYLKEKLNNHFTEFSSKKIKPFPKNSI